jgi:hypothetical protein
MVDLKRKQNKHERMKFGKHIEMVCICKKTYTVNLSKGLVVESDEEMADKEDIVPGWMKVSREGPGRKASRKKKTKYRTIDQVIAEAERTSVQANQKVIDYTGPQARTITPADIRSTPTGRATSIRFMELRHNLELLTNMAREDVTRCGREKRILEAQQSEAQGDAERLEAIVNKKSQGNDARRTYRNEH